MHYISGFSHSKSVPLHKFKNGCHSIRMVSIPMVLQLYWDTKKTYQPLTMFENQVYMGFEADAISSQ
jgi:hypothetical protein